MTPNSRSYQGRFLTKDTWKGEQISPISYHKWVYAESNPVNFVDPTGFITIKDVSYANAFVKDLQNKYQVRVKVDWGYLPIPVPTPPDQSDSEMNTECRWKEGEWTINELHTLWLGVASLGNAMGGPTQFRTNTGGITISQDPITTRGLTWPHRIKFTSSSLSIDSWTVVHELAHAWDGNYGWRLSKELEEYTDGYTSLNAAAYKWRIQECDKDKRLPGCNSEGYFYGDIPPAGADVNFNRREDFAESVTAYVYPIEAQRRVERFANDPMYRDFLYYSDYTKTSRWAFVNDLIEGKEFP